MRYARPKDVGRGSVNEVREFAAVTELPSALPLSLPQSDLSVNPGRKCSNDLVERRRQSAHGKRNTHAALVVQWSRAAST